MAETSCLWVVTMRNIVGISLERLMGWGKEVVDWKSISPLPFDFHRKLPEELMTPFVHDSKLFLAGGLIRHQSPDISYKIYELFFDKDGDDNDKKKSFLRISEATPDSIPPSPTALPHSFIANVGSKVYLLVYDARKGFRTVKRKEGFWALGSGGKDWQALPGPPPMYLDGFGYGHAFFVLQDKLFFEVCNVRDRNDYLYAFDTQTHKWDQLDDNIRNSYSFLEDERAVLFPSIMVASLPLPDNYRDCNCTRVTLSWSWKNFSHSQVRVKIHAMLLNNQDNSVVCYQSLDEVSEAIQPSYFSWYTTRLNFVELGNGLVCALVNGSPPEFNYGTTPVLCVLVFSLSFAGQPAHAFGFAGKKQRFLDVDVRVNRVFTLANIRGDNFQEELEHALIFPSEKEEQHACSKGTTSPPRKQQKLASGTKPS